jgi:hypothetical protein
MISKEGESELGSLRENNTAQNDNCLGGSGIREGARLSSAEPIPADLPASLAMVSGVWPQLSVEAPISLPQPLEWR